MPIDSTLNFDHSALHVRGPDDLLHLVPYLLGFHPSESFVVVGLRGAQVAVTARSDLGDLDVARRMQQLVRALVQAEARDVIAIVYSGDPVGSDAAMLPHGRVVADFGDLAEQSGLTFLDALLLSGGRWWSYCCSDDSCCLSQGRVLDDSSPSPIAAAATVAGLVALPDRASLAAQLDPVPWAEREALHPLLAAHENAAFEAVLGEQTRRRHRSLVRALFAAARRADARDLTLSDDDVARFGVALSAFEIRDSVWVAVDEQRLDGRDLWRLLARRLPAPYDATPLFLVGWRAWRDGNGALAAIAAERAVESDPQCTPADLLLAAVTEAVDPQRLPRIRPARFRVPRPA